MQLGEHHQARPLRGSAGYGVKILFAIGLNISGIAQLAESHRQNPSVCGHVQKRFNLQS